MPKKQNKKTAQRAPEAVHSRSVGGETIPPNAAVHEHGNPESSSIVQYVEADYSLTLPDELTEIGYIEIGRKIGAAMEGASWRIGDWANFGKAKFGYKDYEKLQEITGLSEVYLRTCSSIAERVDAAFRPLASMERFRLMLPMRDTIIIPEAEQVKGGGTKRAEPIPAMIERLKDWNQTELRHKTKTPTLAAGNAGRRPEVAEAKKAAEVAADAMKKAATDPTNAEAARVAAEATQKAADAAKKVAETTPAPEPKAAPLAGKVYQHARELAEEIELLTPERIALLATMEKQNPVFKPLAGMLKILRDQLWLEMDK